MPSYSTLDDLALVDLLKKADQHAFAEIYNRYWKRLLAIAYNHTKDKSSAEEIVQEIFVSLWDRKDNIEIRSVNNYLATATKFRVFKSYYHQQKQQNNLIKKIEAHSSPNLEEEIDARFLQEYISGLVEKLPDKCRIVFKYSRTSGLRVSEIAKEMNIAEKTVEAHLTKALKTLRVNLNQLGISIILLTDIFNRHI